MSYIGTQVPVGRSQEAIRKLVYAHRGTGISFMSHPPREGLTQQLEHLDILPRGESEARRATGQYGRYGDVRVQGDPPRTEYRTMGSWLLSPSVAMLCLTGAKLAACDPEGVPGTMVDYDGLKDWFGKYKEDRDVEFVQNYILTKPLKHLQVDPDSDFRSKWERVGVEEQHGKR